MKGKCKNEGVTGRYLEEAVLNVIRDEVLNRKNVENLLKAIRKKSSTYLSEEKEVRERLESVEKRLRKYQDLFEREKIDEDAFVELTKT